MYRNGHLSFGTEPGPLAADINTDDVIFANEGSGTVFCLFMTVPEFCAAFYRVKKWKLSGDIIVNKGSLQPGDTLYTGSSFFELIFTRRSGIEQELTELDLYALGKSVSLMSSQAQSFQFSGIATYKPAFPLNATPTTDNVTYNFVADIDAATSYEIGIDSVGKSVTKPGKLTVSFKIEMDLNGITDGNQVVLFNRMVNAGVLANPFLPPIVGDPIANLQVYGEFAEPGGEDLTVPIFEFEALEAPTGEVSLSNFKLEPQEWFTYEVNGLGPVYDSATGEFV